MTTRVLPPEEYERLRATFDTPLPDHAYSRIVVAEEGNEIVGHLFLVGLAHVDGAAIKPDRRGGDIFQKMLDKVEETARDHDLKTLMVCSPSAGLDRHFREAHYQLEPWTVWTKEI